MSRNPARLLTPPSVTSPPDRSSSTIGKTFSVPLCLPLYSLQTQPPPLPGLWPGPRRAPRPPRRRPPPVNNTKTKTTEHEERGERAQGGMRMAKAFPGGGAPDHRCPHPTEVSVEQAQTNVTMSRLEGTGTRDRDPERGVTPRLGKSRGCRRRVPGGGRQGGGPVAGTRSVGAAIQDGRVRSP